MADEGVSAMYLSFLALVAFGAVFVLLSVWLEDEADDDCDDCRRGVKHLHDND